MFADFPQMANGGGCSSGSSRSPQPVVIIPSAWQRCSSTAADFCLGLNRSARLCGCGAGVKPSGLDVGVCVSEPEQSRKPVQVQPVNLRPVSCWPQLTVLLSLSSLFMCVDINI